MVGAISISNELRYPRVETDSAAARNISPWVNLLDRLFMFLGGQSCPRMPVKRRRNNYH